MQSPGAARTTGAFLLVFLCFGGQLRAQSIYSGAVAEKSAPTSVGLTLAEGIRMGIRNNLGTLLADDASREARVQRMQALARLLPEVTARVEQSSRQTNLAAFGFAGFPGVSSIVGPFSIFDARAVVTQPLLNFRVRNGVRASAETVRAAGLDYQDARDTVTGVVTALYMDALAGEGRIAAAKARVASAEAAFTQAKEFKENGVVPGIDVLRAEVQARTQRQRLIALENEAEKQKLHLARAVGLPAATKLTLADAMPADPGRGVPSVAEAVDAAVKNRMDYQGLDARIHAAEFRLKAAGAGKLPTVNFNGDYGTIGKSPNNSHGTYSATISVSMPLFDGNRVKAEQSEAEIEIQRLREQQAELRGRMEFEIREAQLNLHAATEQLAVARGALDLARLQETQARDRFAAGVTGNLEVVQAQEAVAAADENVISSLLAGNLARASLARAMGATEKNMATILAMGNGK